MDADTRIERDRNLATTHTIVWPAGTLDTERLASACAEVTALDDAVDGVMRSLRGGIRQVPERDARAA